MGDRQGERSKCLVCFGAVILGDLCFGLWCTSARAPLLGMVGRGLEWPRGPRSTSARGAGPPASQLKSKELCKIYSAPTLHWGWEEACHLVPGGDETCELFLASNMSRDVTSFINTASRAADPYKPSLVRLKSRIVEAVLEDRALNILAIGASNTVGRGCPSQEFSEHLRWSGALQNLSNFIGSPLPVKVLNAAAGATTLRQGWYSMLYQYKDNDDFAVDLIVIDYELAEPAPLDKKKHLESVALVQQFVQKWKRPPAILFLEVFNGHTFMLLHRTDPCNVTRDFANETAFYSAAKEFKLPLLSYPDIACRLPRLNRTSISKIEAPFLHVYRTQGSFVHYGCGVHLILAHAINLYLNRLLQDSCGAKPDQKQRCIPSLKDFCAAGFQSTLESVEESELGVDVARLSPEGRCQMNMLDSWSFAPGNIFPALTSTDSKWYAGADRPQKFGWIANEQPFIRLERTEPSVVTQDQTIRKYAEHLKVSKAEIIFFVRLSAGIVLLDFLSTYENIGPIYCQLEDLEGKKISDRKDFQGLRPRHKYSMSKREMLFAKAGQVPKLPPKGPNAALRCTERGQKFKFIGISSC